MTFKTSPNRILVTEAGGHVTLDTSEPMPHILQTAQVSASVNFPNCTSRCDHSHFTRSYPHNYTVCGTENECGFQNVCGPQMQCGFKDVCSWGYDSFGNYGYWCTQQYVCENVTVCQNQYVCTPVFACREKPGTRHETQCDLLTVTLNSMEWQQDVNLLALTNPDVDFVQVQVSTSRTAAGTDPKYGTFQAILPAGWMLAQGTTLMESSFLPGGSSWLRRIMSIVIEGGYVKARFKSSNRGNSFNAGSNGVVGVSYDPWDNPGIGGPMAMPDTNAAHSSIASNFSLIFNITVGKFTS